jgi:hypothetical protein
MLTLEYIGGSTTTRHGSVAVFGNGNSCTGCHKRSDSRYVKCASAIATGTTGINCARIDIDIEGVFTHDLGHAGNLGSSLTFEM